MAITTKNLTTVASLTNMGTDDCFIVATGNGVRKVPLEDVRDSIAGSVAGATYTLEETSSPKFDVASDSAAVNGYIGHMGGYMFKKSGGKEYAAKLNPSDWTKFQDGTSVGDTSRFETMIHVPTCNFKASGNTMNFGGLTYIDGGQTFGSPEWVGAYKMYVDASNVGHSRPGVAPAHSKTMSTFWSCAQARGPLFGLANYGFHCLINAVFQAKYGNLDSQSVIGTGFQSDNWEACRDVVMGKTTALGDGSGSVTYSDETLGTQHPVKLFGFEDLWGKLWEFRPGIRFAMDGTQRYAVIYDGNVVSNTASGRRLNLSQPGSDSFAKSMVLGARWDMLADTVGGSSATYYCDGWWEATDGELLCVGGNAYSGARCGVSCANSIRGFPFSWTIIGARLAFYGVPTIVSGSELVALA